MGTSPATGKKLNFSPDPAETAGADRSSCTQKGFLLGVTPIK